MKKDVNKMKKDVNKLNKLINSINESELQYALMFVSTICQDGKLIELKKYLRLKPGYCQFI